MITKDSIHAYCGVAIDRGDRHLYIPPNASLRPYISHYCISFPTQETMSDMYTVLPSANAVLCVFVGGGKVNVAINGTNTKAVVVGTSANKNDVLLLVKFRAGGFFPFYGFSQDELVDFSMDLSCVDKALSCEIENAILKSERIEDLAATLDYIFVKQLKRDNNEHITAAMHRIISKNGNITTCALSEEINYSEKHIRRLFLQYIGTTPKKFSRIVRVNYALRLLREFPLSFADVTEKAGFYDQAHFIHDFKDIFALTPNEYIKNTSNFFHADAF